MGRGTRPRIAGKTRLLSWTTLSTDNMSTPSHLSHRKETTPSVRTSCESRPITRPLAHSSSSHQSSSSGLATPGRSTKADIWLRTIELDLRPHNLGLNTAWMRAQDCSKWCQLVETAMLTDGCSIRWWWWCWWRAMEVVVTTGAPTCKAPVK